MDEWLSIRRITKNEQNANSFSRYLNAICRILIKLCLSAQQASMVSEFCIAYLRNSSLALAVLIEIIDVRQKKSWCIFNVFYKSSTGSCMYLKFSVICCEYGKLTSLFDTCLQPYSATISVHSCMAVFFLLFNWLWIHH